MDDKFYKWIGREGMREINALPHPYNIGLDKLHKLYSAIICRTDAEWYSLYLKTQK